MEGNWKDLILLQKDDFAASSWQNTKKNGEFSELCLYKIFVEKRHSEAKKQYL